MSFLTPRSSNVSVEVTGGASGGNSNLATFTSIGPVSAHRVVAATSAGIVYADKDTLTDQDRIIGLTMSSVSAAGEEVTYIMGGLATDPSFSFSPGPIYLGTAGMLTQTKPTSGLLIQVANAVDANKLQFDIQLNVRLA